MSACRTTTSSKRLLQWLRQDRSRGLLTSGDGTAAAEALGPKHGEIAALPAAMTLSGS